jgi:hypothetical protein
VVREVFGETGWRLVYDLLFVVEFSEVVHHLDLVPLIQQILTFVRQKFLFALKILSPKVKNLPVSCRSVVYGASWTIFGIKTADLASKI